VVPKAGLEPAPTFDFKCFAQIAYNLPTTISPVCKARFDMLKIDFRADSENPVRCWLAPFKDTFSNRLDLKAGPSWRRPPRIRRRWRRPRPSSKKSCGLKAKPGKKWGGRRKPPRSARWKEVLVNRRLNAYKKIITDISFKRKFFWGGRNGITGINRVGTWICLYDFAVCIYVFIHRVNRS